MDPVVVIIMVYTMCYILWISIIGLFAHAEILGPFLKLSFMMFRDLISFFILTVSVFIGFVLALYFIVAGKIRKDVEDAEDDQPVVFGFYYNYTRLKRLHYMIMRNLLLIFSKLYGDYQSSMLFYTLLLNMFGVDFIGTIFIFLYSVNIGFTRLFMKKAHATQAAIIATY